jgi:dihydroceramidase
MAFAMFIVIGFGSAAFHGTLWRSMQLMDELPMVWANGIFIFIIITMEDTKRPRKLEAWIIAGVTAVLSLAIVFIDAAAAKEGKEGSGQDVFLVTYGSGKSHLL